MKESIAAANAAVGEAIKANNIARDALVTENRAWLKLHLRFEGPVSIRDGILSMTYFILVENVGRTPALSPRMAFDRILHPGQLNNEMVQGVLRQSAINGPFCPYVFRGETETAPGYSGGVAIPEDNAAFGVPRIYACVRYRVIGSQEDHITYKGFDLWAALPNGRAQFMRDAPNKSNIPISVSETGGGLIT